MESPQSDASVSPQKSPKLLSKAIGAIAAVLALVGVAKLFGPTGSVPVAADEDGDESAEGPIVGQAPQPTEEPVTESSATASDVTGAGSYNDGTYTAEGSYVVHKGPEKITIGITLKDNIITDTTFQSTPNIPMSQRFMDMFSQNYKAMVVGKNIDEVNLTKVSGSSLTPQGFNDALAKIKAQAKP